MQLSKYQEFLADARRQVSEVSAPEARDMLTHGPAAAVIDVREKNEWDEGHIPGARHIPRGYLELDVERVLPDKTQPVLLYCASGIRSVFAAQTLKQMGYTDVSSIAGGFTNWKDRGLPFEVPRSLSASQLHRYSRHVLIPEVGERGQIKLLDAKVLLIGAGGLGSPSALYLAAAGIGTIGIVDSDIVDESNLQRQVIHTTERVGQSKVESARESIRHLNPDVNVVGYEMRLTPENARGIVSEYDIVVDGVDNFDTRYLINELCVELDKPNVSASILSFDGQLTTFVAGEGPCYRCVYREPPPPALAPT